MQITLEPYFDFIMNEAGELMMIMEARGEAPSPEAMLAFDGRELAYLFRDRSEIVKLTEIPEEVLGILKRIKKILVTEMDEADEVAHSYEAEVTIEPGVSARIGE